MDNLNYERIAKDSFGLWISALFSAAKGGGEDVSFEEQKGIFFHLLRVFLQEGRVKFCPPNELWCEGYDVWDVDVDSILNYFLTHWPSDVNSENDIKLTDYFYDMPAILWVADDGTLHGS
ncbi:hypothetical protein [Chromobacterium subtsugae]|uniref:hypothetical protein n=1 Tax=Chromobacterium subtsugae TaxID=251747 RepID=UPI0009BB579E|nr:hypothetical protein [Chromobacterium subtsugae]